MSGTWPLPWSASQINYKLTVVLRQPWSSPERRPPSGSACRSSFSGLKRPRRMMKAQAVTQYIITHKFFWVRATATIFNRNDLRVSLLDEAGAWSFVLFIAPGEELMRRWTAWQHDLLFKSDCEERLLCPIATRVGVRDARVLDVPLEDRVQKVAKRKTPSVIAVIWNFGIQNHATEVQWRAFRILLSSWNSSIWPSSNAELR